MLDVTDMRTARSASASGGPSTDVEILMHSGDPFVLRCSEDREVSRWTAAINERIAWKMAEVAAIARLAESGTTGALLPSSLMADVPVCPVMCGWLKKKGKHKYTGQQVNLCTLHLYRLNCSSAYYHHYCSSIIHLLLPADTGAVLIVIP